MPAIVPTTFSAARTPVSAKDLATRLRDAGLSIEASELAIAHSALETGWWKECWNYNLGNAKAGPYQDHCFRECGEELPATSVDINDARVKVVREYERNGTRYLSVVFSPNHPQTRFRAFPSLSVAIKDHLDMLARVFPKSLAALKTGVPKAYAAALAAEGYYTADPNKYAEGLAGVLAMVRTKAVWWGFEPKAGESKAERVVRCCNSLLSAGPVGADKLTRPHVYRSFINCEQRPAGTFFSTPIWDISSTKTSCGLFVRAVLYWCGRATKPAVISGPLTGYVQADFSSACWRKWDGQKKPSPGDVFFTPRYGGHVGIFLEEASQGLWHTAEGGGGDGTLCQLASRRLETVQGWWELEGLGLPASPAPGLSVPPPDGAIPPDKDETVPSSPDGPSPSIESAEQVPAKTDSSTEHEPSEPRQDKSEPASSGTKPPNQDRGLAVALISVLGIAGLVVSWFLERCS